jgi:FkbM family methyltransferase
MSGVSNFVPYIGRDFFFGDHTFDFWITDPVAQLWYNSPNQSMPERWWCFHHIKPGMTVVDCGAHHGMMSVLFSKWTAPKGCVVAYEVVPGNRAVIEQNVTLNGLSNVVVRPYGVAAHKGKLMLKEDSNAHPGGDAEFDVTTIDDDLAGKRVHFLKMDVEGGELEALRGARQLLRQKPIVDLEIHNFHFQDRVRTLREIFALLSPRDWSYELLPEIAGTPTPVDGPLDLDDLAKYDNPHVFCIPRTGFLTSWLRTVRMARRPKV